MTATKTRAAARLSVQVQQVWIGRKSGFGSGVPWRYSDKNPFGLTEVKYPPLLLANVHRFQMRLQPSTKPLHTTPLLNRGTRIKTVSHPPCASSRSCSTHAHESQLHAANAAVAYQWRTLRQHRHHRDRGPGPSLCSGPHEPFKLRG